MNRENLTQILREIEKEPPSLEEIVYRSVEEVLPDRRSLERRLKEKRARLYLGIDPTSPDLHIGHTVPLRKLRHFQDMGHEVFLLFGTFTGMIGDPSEKSAARVRLTRDQIATNIATYSQQAGKILDLSTTSPNPVQIKHNDTWLAPLSFEEVVDLASNFTVQQMLERKMFKERIKDEKPIWLHEFLYPLMQGWDAVAMEVDIEVGGKDQTFNMMVGRDLVKRYLGKDKWVVATKLIEDPSGRKMGKTEGNIVNLNDWPEVKFEAIMTWPDSAIPVGFELLTSVPKNYYHIVAEELSGGRVHPMELKQALAYRVVAELDGKNAAAFAELEFDNVMRKGQQPSRIKEVSTSKGSPITSVLVECRLASNEAAAKGMLARNAVYLDGKPIRTNVVINQACTIQHGKRTIKNIRRITIT